LPGFKLYIPNVTGVRDHLSQVGLGPLSTDCAPEWESIGHGRGPDGGWGMVCAWRLNKPEIDSPMGIPAGWKWVPSPPDDSLKLPKGSWWFGYDPEKPPGPASFTRTKQYPGHLVTLGDKRDWLIPSAYAVPEHYGINLETGKKEVTVDEQFQRFCFTAFRHATEFYSREEEIAVLARVFRGVKVSKEDEAIVSKLAAKDGATVRDLSKINPVDLAVTVPLEDAIDHAWAALGFNYRMHPVIATILELLDRQAVVQICLAAIDLQKVAEHVKKNDPERPISLPSGSTMSFGE
jgi:hypothetical protein